jgi:hypothetical protein
MITAMKPEYLRDAAMTAAIFGFFGFVWFGMAQEAPPGKWRPWLGVGSAVSILIAIGGGVLAWQHWDDGSALDAESGPIFGIVVAVEVILAAAGAVIVSMRGRKDLVTPWLAIVVGLHFVPLAWFFSFPVLGVMGVLMAAAGVAGVPLARSKGLAASAVVGVASGLLLVATALLSLAVALTW